MLEEDGTELEPRVADAMHWGLVSCPSGASLTSVAALMTDERVHCVVVIDDLSSMGSLWGVISDLDLIAAASVRGLAEQTAGGTAMTPAVTIAPDERARARCRPHDEARSGAPRRRRSRRAAARRSGVEPRPRRRPGHAVARFASSDRSGTFSLPASRANVRRNTPFGVSSREFTAGTGRLSTVAGAKRPDQSVRMTTWPTVDDRDVTHRDSRRGAGRRSRLPALAAHRPHSALLADTLVRNNIASRAWADPPSGRRNHSR